MLGMVRRGLELLKQGLTAQEVLDKLVEEDVFPGKDMRQVAIIDARGNVAVRSGTEPEWAGDRKGETYSVQGNTLVGPEVVDAMAEAFEATTGELAERLYAALKAGDDAGGDRRGRQSASILVVKKGAGRGIDDDRYILVNVDDHPDPFAELRRLLDGNLFLNHSNRFMLAAFQDDATEMQGTGERVLQYAPPTVEGYWYSGFVQYLLGDKDSAVSSFHSAREADAAYFQLMWGSMTAAPVSDTPIGAMLTDEEFVARVEAKNQ